jgi:tetratricopeptide (TPR) repeat protein
MCDGKTLIKQQDSKSIVLLFQNYSKIWLSLGLMVITLSVFSPVLENDFIGLDDPSYVSANPVVRQGLTWAGFVWAFTDISRANWHPLTWLSHMLDVQIYGFYADGHHFTSLLFHAASAVILFVLMTQMTGAIWRSFFIAMFFSIHPLRVESVAWIAERKDVLSCFFGLLCLWAYWHYCRRPGVLKMILVVGLFLVGLMCKSMLVTLPCVMLLLDNWPLNRFHQSDLCGRNQFVRHSVYKLILEKTPLFVLSLIFSLVAFVAQHAGKSMPGTEIISFRLRLENSLLSYWYYIGDMFYPVGLCIYYPLDRFSRPFSAAILSSVGLFVVTSLVFIFRKKYPYGLTGWFWFIVMLLPVIGVIKIGEQSHADRYTYLPSIGITLWIIWVVSEQVMKNKNVRNGAVIVAVGILIVLGVSTFRQCRLWKNDLTLFSYTLKLTEHNWVIHQNYAVALKQNGDINEAERHSLMSISLNPSNSPSYAMLGTIYLEKNQPVTAIDCLEAALKTQYSDRMEILFNLGIAYSMLHNYSQSYNYFQKALEVDPENTKVIRSISSVLKIQNLHRQALEIWMHYLSRNPVSVEALCAAAWDMAVSPDPNVLNPELSLHYAKEAAELAEYHSAAILDVLAAAYARHGDFDKAVEAADAALQKAQSKNLTELIAQIQKRRQYYESKKPWTQEIQPTGDL